MHAGSTQSQKAEHDDVFDRNSHFDRIMEGNLIDKNRKSEGETRLYEIIRPLHSSAPPAPVSIRKNGEEAVFWLKVGIASTFLFRMSATPPAIYLIACLSIWSDSDAITLHTEYSVCYVVDECSGQAVIIGGICLLPDVS